MKQIVATVTERGQVTIPAEVRRALGLKAPDKVAFAVDEDQVRLLPLSFTLDSAFGSVTPLAGPQDFKEVSREARSRAADRTIRKMRKP